MRGGVAIFEGIPDFASLYPGYACLKTRSKKFEWKNVGSMRQLPERSRTIEPNHCEL
jgi:hypothetical protein